MRLLPSLPRAGRRCYAHRSSGPAPCCSLRKSAWLLPPGGGGLREADSSARIPLRTVVFVTIAGTGSGGPGRIVDYRPWLAPRPQSQGCIRAGLRACESADLRALIPKGD